MVARESTARTGIQEVMEATQQRVTERTAENVNVLEKEMERSTTFTCDINIGTMLN